MKGKKMFPNFKKSDKLELLTYKVLLLHLISDKQNLIYKIDAQIRKIERKENDNIGKTNNEEN